jgi:hypothetical protein
MYHLIDQGCQVQNPMRSIFFYSHVYVYIEMSPQKVLTPSPHVALMRLSLDINRQDSQMRQGLKKVMMVLMRLGLNST